MKKKRKRTWIHGNLKCCRTSRPGQCGYVSALPPSDTQPWDDDLENLPMIPLESPTLWHWGTPVDTTTGWVVGQHLNSSVLRMSGWFSPKSEYNVPNQWEGWLTSYCVPTSPPCHRFYIHNLKGEMKYVIVPNYSYYITGLIIAMLLLLNYLDMAWLCRVSCFDNFEHLGPEVRTSGGELTGRRDLWLLLFY